MKFRICIPAAVAGLLLSASAMAAPSHMPVQGFLQDGTSAPVDGTVSLTFRLYTTSTGGAPVWEDTFASVTIDDGHFMVNLGSGAQSLDMDLFEDGTDLWAGISIGGGAELSPRIGMGMTGFAGWAANVPFSGIDGLPADLADGDDDTTYTFQAPLRTTGGTTVGFSTTGCVAGEAWVWNGSAWDCTATTYSATNGIVSSGTTFSLDEPYVVNLVTANAYNTPAEVEAALGGAFQRPLTGAGECTGNSSIRAIAADGSFECQPGSSGTISGVTAGTGLTGGGTSGTVTVAVDPSAVQLRITGSCTNAGEFLVGIEQDGDPICAALPSAQVYNAGTGLSLTGNTFAVDFATTQRRVGDCVGANDYIWGVNADGSPKCRTAQALDVNAFADSNQSCPSGQVVYGFNSSGGVLCRNAPTADTDTNTTYNGACPGGQAVVSLNSAGGFSCGYPQDTNTTYNANCGGGWGNSIYAIWSNGTVSCGRQAGYVYNTGSCGYYANAAWVLNNWSWVYCPGHRVVIGYGWNINTGWINWYYDSDGWSGSNWRSDDDVGGAHAQIYCCDMYYY